MIVLAFLATLAWADTPLELGKLEFQVATNVKAFSFKGQAKELKGAIVAEKGEPKSVKFQVPVESLTTGMSLRDRHMKERIFQKADGTAPDIEFVADKIECPSAAAERTCQVSGQLTLRGESRPIMFPARLRNSGKGAEAEGEVEIRLSQFGIVAPAHLGVRVEDGVKIVFSVRSPQS